MVLSQPRTLKQPSMIVSTEPDSKASKLVWTGVVLLFVLHHDFWFWGSKTLVFGFMPIGLFYHLMFSLAAAGIWAAAVKWAWPSRIEEWASELEDQAAPAAAIKKEEGSKQ